MKYDRAESDYISKSALIEALEKSKKDNRHITGEGYGVHIQEHRHLIHLVEKQPTLDEKEIIRKPFERVVERLEECEQRYDDVAFAEMNENGHTLDFEYAKGKKYGVEEAIEIVKEECGISE